MVSGVLCRTLAGVGRRLGMVSPAICSRAPLCRAPYSTLFSDPEEAVEEDESQLNKYHEPVALVTGASRGLGLEFTRQLLTKYPGVVVYGTARNPDASEGLQALKRRHPIRCELARMDVTKEDTVEALAKEIDEKYGRLDLIVNCAGILHKPNEIKPEEALSVASLVQTWASVSMYSCWGRIHIPMCMYVWLLGSNLGTRFYLWLLVEDPNRFGPWHARVYLWVLGKNPHSRDKTLPSLLNKQAYFL